MNIILTKKERKYWIYKQNYDDDKKFSNNYKYVIKSRTKKKIQIAFEDMKKISLVDSSLREFILDKNKEQNNFISGLT